MHAMKWLAIPAALMATVVFAQKPAEPKAPTGGKESPAAEKGKRPTLEELLSAALQHSPEVQVAEAKLKEAEAQLKQTRLQIAQRLVDLYTSSETQHKNLVFAEEEFKRVALMKQAGTASTGEYAETERKLQVLKGQVAQLEASVATLTGRLPALNQLGMANPLSLEFRGHAMGGGGGLGLGGGMGGGGLGDGQHDGPKPRWPRQAMADRMHKALEKTIDKGFNKGSISIQLIDLAEFVRDRCGDVPFLIKLDDQADASVKLNFQGDVTVGGFFEILSDSVPDLKIFVRDYGFLITFSPGAPDDGLLVGDFWRQRQMQAK